MRVREERKTEHLKASQGDRKVKTGMEKRKAMEVLTQSSQVTIIGKDGKLKGLGREKLRLGRSQNQNKK